MSVPTGTVEILLALFARSPVSRLNLAICLVFAIVLVFTTGIVIKVRDF